MTSFMACTCIPFNAVDDFYMFFFFYKTDTVPVAAGEEIPDVNGNWLLVYPNATVKHI